ncbi:MAG: polysaccharide biosynthesis C-terminal domain-containing protein, partial [Planctomycetes bacterium]|nr:polysaccharide biosynthesis C-terminal domain-containing protein [Planctomycetota bacterium]
LETGTASSLYFAQRMYQFPLGVFGVALGTVLFPLMAAHAAQGRLDRLRESLDLGLRLVLAVGLPASVGLILIARPLTGLFFQHGEFDAAAAGQTAAMIVAYSVAVWAYCGLPVAQRAFYAMGDRRTPMRVGLWAVGLNLVLDFALLPFLGGTGLALATALAAIVQVSFTAWLAQARVGRLDWRRLALTALRAVCACTAMAAAVLASLALVPAGEGWSSRLAAVGIPLTAGALTYLCAARAFRLGEVWLLFRSDSAAS